MRPLPRNVVLVGDALRELRRLPGASVDMVLTSPPYFRLRDYGVDGQLGLEPAIENWTAGLQAVAREVARVLVPTGSFWLNLGDSYATHAREGASRKSLLLGPERLALALVGDGWTLRNKIVWQKANPVPTSVRDRLSTTWEPVYVFVRQSSYYFDLDSLRVPHVSRPPKRHDRVTRPKGRESWRGPNGDDASGLVALKAAGRIGHPLGKNPGDIWRIGSSAYRGGHHATYPVALAARAIQAGCPEARCVACRLPWRRTHKGLGGVAVRGALQRSCRCGGEREPGLVLDPFFGAGTTAVAAETLERDWLGTELNPEFAAQALRRIHQTRAAPRRAA